MRSEPQGAVPSPIDTLTELPRAAAADSVLGALEGTVLALGGIDGESLRILLDAVEPDRCARRALFAHIAPASTAEAIAEQIIAQLAETARCLWPTWFTDVSFAECRDDELGRRAVGVIARNAAEGIAGLLPS